jgi:hypothetical protein
VDLFQFIRLLLVLCYDPFLGVPVRDTLLRTQVVHHSLAFEAKICLEGAMAIVEACMNDLDSSDHALVRERLDGAYKPCLGISAAGLLSDRAMLLNHDG